MNGRVVPGRTGLSIERPLLREPIAHFAGSAIMIIKKRAFHIPSSEVTPEGTYLKRRDFLKKVGIGGVGALIVATGPGAPLLGRATSVFASKKHGDAPSSYDEV